ncbi:hypothetical protein F5887DRAFT_845452, partial [Amanita rubescens]
QSIESLVSYPFALYVTDEFGRRTSIIIYEATYSLALGACLGSFFLIGFGLTFTARGAPLLVTELAYPS